MFQIGDKVKALAFVDSFGKAHAEVTNLIVRRVYEIQGAAPHTRLLTQAEHDGWITVEAATHAFEKEESA